MWKNNGVKTALYYSLETPKQGLTRFNQLYQASADNLKQTIEWYQKQNNLYSVYYKEITGPNAWQNKSQNAKSRLNQNPAYQNFLSVMKEGNPEVAALIDSFKTNDTITEQETNFIKKHLLGSDSIKQMMDLRSQMIKEQWPWAAAYFKDYQSLLDISKDLNNTKEDDLIENMNTPTWNVKNLFFKVSTWY